jgi:hypothetical protein
MEAATGTTRGGTGKGSPSMTTNIKAALSTLGVFAVVVGILSLLFFSPELFLAACAIAIFCTFIWITFMLFKVHYETKDWS